jgi:hypothetical protein
MRGLSLRHVMVGAAAVVAALAVGVSVASAAGGATLSLQVIPSSLISGGPGFVFAKFTNTGNSTLTHVIVNVDLGSATLDASGTDAACTGSGSTVSCSLGNVKKGGVVVSTIAFTAPGDSDSVTVGGTATWDAASVGNPKGAAGSKDTATAVSVTANVVDLSGVLHGPVASGCFASDGSVSSGNINVSVSGNTSGLPCAPVVAGATTRTSTNGECGSGAELLFAKVSTGQTAQVTLNFVDGCLPWPDNNDGSYTGPPPGYGDAENAGQPLLENPIFPNPGGDVTVPWCGQSAPTSGGPYSTDACIVSVNSVADPDGDNDAGTIVLSVTGGPGDGGFHPG